MGREGEESQLFPAESYTDAAADTSGAGGEQKMKARQRQRRRKPKPALEGGADEQLAKKRRLSDEQARYLELSFREERKLETPRKVQLAAELGLDAKQVAVWFQNRRARHKSKIMEEEFARLRDAHDAAVLQNCQLETELLKLKDRLAEAEEEKRKLSTNSAAAGVGAVAGGGGSPSSSTLSTVTTCNLAALMGQFGVDEDAADLSCMNNDYAYTSYMMDSFAAGYFGGIIFNGQFN